MKPIDWINIGVVGVAVIGGAVYLGELSGRVDGLGVDAIKKAQQDAIARIGNMSGEPELIDRIYSWKQGEDEKPMIRTDEGFCYLTRIQGKFEGYGEVVSVHVKGDYWYLGGKSKQLHVAAEARCWRWSG